MSVERLDICNDSVYVIGRLRRAVYLIDIFSIDGIEFQNVIVDFCQRLMNLRAVDERRVTEDRKSLLVDNICYVDGLCRQ